MADKVQGVVSLFSGGPWSWDHDGQSYAIRFPSMDDDLRINALRARTIAALGGADYASWLFQSDLADVVSLLEVCLAEHPPGFKQVSGKQVAWRVGGALNRAELQDYPEIQGRPESAWTCAVREGRAFLAFFRPPDSGAGAGSGDETRTAGAVAGAGGREVPPGGTPPT